MSWYFTTRLSGMPYDSFDARNELTLVDTALRASLVRKLKEAKRSAIDFAGLKLFATHVLANAASIVTFNYDDVLDEALRNVAEDTRDPAWHPDGGYGFYCRPSSVCVDDTPRQMNKTHSLVLKLHGSINWRSRLGVAPIRGPEAILHHEEWLRERVGAQQPPLDRIESHLEPDPVVVPPVLVKSELALHPVLRVVWKLAHERLLAARRVVFIGYSMPVTDLASRILFRETLVNRSELQIEVVSLAGDPVDKRRVENAYRSLFDGLDDSHFHFGGARAWIENHVSMENLRVL